MPNSESDKQNIIRSLLVTKQEANSLEISLRFRGKVDEAEKLSKKAKDLSKEVDRLLGQAMLDWVAQADKTATDIGMANASLKSSIKEIQKGIEVAGNIVKAIGFVDDVVVIASKIAKAL